MSTLDNTPGRPGVVAREPVAVGNLVAALVVNVAILLDEFGVPLTPGQHKALIAVAVVLALLVSTLFGRGKATPLVDPRDATGRPLLSSVPPNHPLA